MSEAKSGAMSRVSLSLTRATSLVEPEARVEIEATAVVPRG